MNLVDPLLGKRQKIGQLPWESKLMQSILGPTGSSTRFGEDSWRGSFLSSANSVVEDRSVDILQVGQACGISGTVAYRGMPRSKAERVDTTDEVLRGIALDRWKILIYLDLSQSRVGRQLQKVISAPDSSLKAEQIIADTLEAKATATLNCRSGSLLQYTAWLTLTMPCTPPYPISEELIYTYLCDLRAHKAPATKCID